MYALLVTKSIEPFNYRHGTNETVTQGPTIFLSFTWTHL